MIIKILYIILICFSPFALCAGDGHDHDHGHSHSHDEEEEESENAEPAEVLIKFEAIAPPYELVAKYLPPHLGDTAIFKIYLSDFASNAPLWFQALQVRCPLEPKAPMTITTLDSGIYEIKVLFAEAGPHSLEVRIGDTTLVINQIQVEAHEHAAHSDSAHEHHHHWYTSIWFVFPMGLLAGALLMLLWRKPRQAAAILVMVLAQQTQAGDGHDHDHSPPPAKSTNTGSLEFEISKETQFLFGIRTQMTVSSEFQPATSLFGNVVATPNGKAEVQAPHYGRVTSVAVRVGQAVTAGQTLLGMEQTVGTGDNVAISTQTGNLQLELERAQQRLILAEKELARLEPIRDIVGQKVLQQANAEQQQAAAEVARLRLMVKSEVPEAKNKMLSIKAPIAGIVTQIYAAQGAYINQGQVLMLIENADKIYIEVQIPSNEYERVSRSQRFTVSALQQSTQQIEAQLLYAVPSLNTFNQTHKMVLEPQNSDQRFNIGEFVSVYAYERQGKQSLVLPISSIAMLEGLSAVFVKVAPERFMLRYVLAPESNGRFVTVQRGLQPNERVVSQATYQAKMIFMNR